MSHIPSSAMPHAKPHSEPEPEPGAAPAKGYGLTGLAVGGAIAAGLALAAAPFLGSGGRKKKAKGKRKKK